MVWDNENWLSRLSVLYIIVDMIESNIICGKGLKKYLKVMNRILIDK